MIQKQETEVETRDEPNGEGYDAECTLPPVWLSHALVVSRLVSSRSVAESSSIQVAPRSFTSSYSIYIFHPW